MARVIAVGVPHHVTQRGNGRRYLLDSDMDRRVYLDLLAQNLDLHGVSLVGYCLMSNHVHLITVPAKLEALAQSMKQTHGRYASYGNAVHQSTGHVWQGRYYSCPLDRPHLWKALRYTELNPVRARLVSDAQSWAWSSAAIHCGATQADPLLSMELWRNQWTQATWREYLLAGESASELASIRQCTHTGRPLGTEAFVQTLEESTKRALAPQKGGRPPRLRSNGAQTELHFDV